MGKLTPAPRGERRKTPPSPQDHADSRALDRAVQSMVEGVLSRWDHTRPLGSLNRDDLRSLAVNAITGWVLERADMAREGDEQIAHELLY